MANSTKGVFAEVDVFAIGTVNEMIGKITEPGKLRSTLCFDTTDTYQRMVGNRNKAIEVGEYGLATDYGKEVILRQETISFHKYAINIGITERARALARIEGTKLGSQGTQIELGMGMMKDNEESRIAYDILNDASLLLFTNVIGGESKHQLAVASANVITMEEVALWQKTMRTSKGSPKWIFCGVNTMDEIAQEFAISLNFASPQAAGWLTEGTIGKVLGMEVIYDERMPDDYLIMGGTVRNQKPVAFFDLVPTKVDERLPSSGLIGAEMNHDYAVQPVGLEGLLVVMASATSYSYPAASAFSFLEQ